MTKLRIIIIVIIVAGLAGAFFLFKDKILPKKDNKDAVDSSNTLSTPIPITTGKSKIGDLPMYVSSSGKLEPIKMNDYTAEVNGNISIKVREGQTVKKGALMFVIDNPEYAIAYEKALLDYKKAYIEYLAIREVDVPMPELKTDTPVYTDDAEIAAVQKNVIEEMKKGNESKERIKYRLGDQELRLKQAQENYKKCRVFAPFTGVIGKIEASEGEYVKPGKALLSLADISVLRVRAKLLVKDIAQIKEGNGALLFPVVTKKRYAGRIYSINPLIYDDNSTYAVVELDNAQGELKPGLFCDVLLQTHVIKGQVLVPKTALLVRDGKPLVFTTRVVNDQNLAWWQYVTVGEENFEYVSIKEGLEKDVEIIVEGHYTLQHKAPIIINDVNIKEGEKK